MARPRPDSRSPRRCRHEGRIRQEAHGEGRRRPEHHAAGGLVMDIADQWEAYFFTQKRTPLATIATPSVPMTKYLNGIGKDPDEFTAICQGWLDAYEALFAWQGEHLMHALNDAWLAMSEAMLAQQLCHVQNFLTQQVRGLHVQLQ